VYDFLAMIKVKGKPWPSILEFYRSISKSPEGKWIIPVLLPSNLDSQGLVF